MARTFGKAARFAGLLAAGAMATLTFAGTASAASAAPASPAYDFPFPGTCEHTTYWWVTTEAVYDHSDSTRNWYKIYVNYIPPDPDDPYDQSNWASCFYN
ncbi:MAG TPA: hypothetical protein VJ914_16340 [Pseudonocardiaceae bacterium]|nr:hypothetical protein [Pseudonocardiaceae bacterium]